MTPAQIEAAQRIGLAVMEAIHECGELGAPEGPIYALLMAQGCTLSQFQSFVGSLERKGKIERDGPHVLKLTADGRQFMGLLQRKYRQPQPA